jgi:hypothetical protein
MPAAAAQAASVQSPKPDTETAREREKKIRVEERAKALMEKKPVVTSGFLVEAARAEKRKSLFSLRAPRDPKHDYKNIAFEERSGRPKGFVLFRWEF